MKKFVRSNSIPAKPAFTSIKGSTQVLVLTPEQVDQVYEIADRYHTSKPVSGNWKTETAHQQEAMVEEMGLSYDEAKAVMCQVLGFPEDADFA